MVWISLYLAPNKLEENKIIYYIYELIGVLKRNWVFDEIKDYHYCWGWNCWWLFFKGDLLETHTKAYMNDIIPVEDSLQKQCGRAQAGRGIDETNSGTAESVMNAWWSLCILFPASESQLSSSPAWCLIYLPLLPLAKYQIALSSISGIPDVLLLDFPPDPKGICRFLHL